MHKFSPRSSALLKTCEPRLIALFTEVVVWYDCTILDNGGARSKELQAKLVADGKSKTMESKHVVDELNPFSRAVDAAAFPVIWPQKDDPHYAQQMGRFYHFAGYVKRVAEQMKLRIRWGGDWDNDLDFTDQTFNDLVHFELIED